MTQPYASLPKAVRGYTPPAYQSEPIYGRVDGIWWRATGAGDPLVLIMGHGYPAAIFHRFVALLEPHCRVIVLDNRGVANSSEAGGLDSLTIGGMASDVAAVIDEAAGGVADVMGVSLGGIVAQELALAFPRKVDRLILAGTHTADSRIVVAEQAVIEMMKNRAQLADTEEALRISLPYVYAPSTPKKLIEEDLDIRRAFHRGWEGYVAQFRATVQFIGTSARLPRIQAETLVVHGKLDRLVPPGNGELIASRIPHSTLRLLPKVSHNFYSENPKGAVAAILPFLQAPRIDRSVRESELELDAELAGELTEELSAAHPDMDADVGMDIDLEMGEALPPLTDMTDGARRKSAPARVAPQAAPKVAPQVAPQVARKAAPGASTKAAKATKKSSVKAKAKALAKKVGKAAKKVA